ncbi:hypothetical protein KC326_g29 [Hortaea werneckii]|nr:hypothetical protein KC326_g29 [Hortaea werneckii]
MVPIIKMVPPATQSLSAEETSNLVTGCNSALDDRDVLRLSGRSIRRDICGREFLVELVTRDQTRHQTLVVTEEGETHDGGDRVAQIQSARVFQRATSVDGECLGKRKEEGERVRRGGIGRIARDDLVVTVGFRIKSAITPSEPWGTAMSARWGICDLWRRRWSPRAARVRRKLRVVSAFVCCLYGHSGRVSSLLERPAGSWKTSPQQAFQQRDRERTREARGDKQMPIWSVGPSIGDKTSKNRISHKTLPTPKIIPSNFDEPPRSTS